MRKVLVKPAKDSFDPKTFLAKVGAGKSISKFGKGQNVFVQGDVADAVFYIQKGKIKLTVVSNQGKEAIVGIFQEDQFFGEGCLDDRTKLRTTTVVALEQCLITSIRKDTMLLTLDSEPGFSAFFITRLVSRINRIEDDLIDQLINRSERRLARQLLLLADFGQEENDKPITVTVNQETLAEMIGATRSRVSTFMNKFRRKGFISYDSYHREIQVYRSLLDAVLHEMPRLEEDE